MFKTQKISVQKIVISKKKTDGIRVYHFNFSG